MECVMWHAVIGQVRGKGLFCGAELVADRATKDPAEEKLVQAVVADCAAQGVLIGATNRSIPGHNNTLCFSPAFTHAGMYKRSAWIVRRFHVDYFNFTIAKAR